MLYSLDRSVQLLQNYNGPLIPDQDILLVIVPDYSVKRTFSFDFLSDRFSIFTRIDVEKKACFVSKIESNDYVLDNDNLKHGLQFFKNATFGLI